MAKLARVARMGSFFCLASALLFGCAGQQSDSSSSPVANPVANLLPGGGYESWVMHQTSDVSGKQISRFGPDGARVENEGMGITYVVWKSPDWKVAVFCDKTKLIYEGSLEEMTKAREQQLKQMEKLDSTANQNFEKGATKQIAGVNATEYFEISKMVNPIDNSTSKTKTSFWVTTDIKVPKQALMANSKRKTYGLPEEGIPLRMTVESDGKEVTYLDTISLAKEPMPKSAFELPSGYKHVTNEMEVVAGPGMAAGLSNLGKLIGEDGEGAEKMDGQLKEMAERMKRLQKEAGAH